MRITEPLVGKEIPRLLGADRRRWMKLVRESLLTTPFTSDEEMARFLCRELAPSAGPDVEAACLDLIQREVDSVVAGEGVLPVLSFLGGRGYSMGLISNLSSAHKEPVARLGLNKRLSVGVYSCDEAAVKPEPGLYLEACRRLDTAPRETLMVGDSLANDVEAPRSLGLRVLRIGGTARDGTPAVRSVAEMGWLCLAPGEELRRLIGDGDEVRIAGGPRLLRGLAPLPDGEQGRYNLVASATAEAPGREPIEVFCKRFLFPEAAHVEELAYSLYREIGMGGCDAWVAPGPEPVLVVSRAPGVKLGSAPEADRIDLDFAEEAGRHCAMAYLFANADLRPRNSFVSYPEGRPLITVVDLEHCFFNLALDVTRLEAPLRPETFDRLAPDELSACLRKRVLTPRTTRRTRRAFLPVDDLSSQPAVAFRRGWVDLYRQVQARGRRLLAQIEERLYTEPYLVIGTQAYRRAMCRIDLEDIASRLARDAEEVFVESF